MNYSYFNIPFFLDSAQAFIDGNKPKISTQNVFIINELDHIKSNISFLSKVLEAIQLDLKTSASLVIIRKNKKVPIMELIDTNKIYNIIVFGINAKSLNFKINTFLYKNISIQNINLLFADSLHDLQNDIPKKRKLWSELQDLFKTNE